MRKVLISLAAAAATVAVAAPASAQVYHRAPPAYGNAYGRANYNVRALQMRVDQIQRQINMLARNRMITRNEYNNLIRQSRQVERNLRGNARDGRGLTQREMYATERQIARLEQNVQRQVRDGRRWRYRW